LPEAAQAKFLPDADHAHARSVDWAEMETAQKGFTERYQEEIEKRGGLEG
jgi:putative spermidine/putrescine transport system substrate-binding protein